MRLGLLIKESLMQKLKAVLLILSLTCGAFLLLGIRNQDTGMPITISEVYRGNVVMGNAVFEYEYESQILGQYGTSHMIVYPPGIRGISFAAINSGNGFDFVSFRYKRPGQVAPSYSYKVEAIRVHNNTWRVILPENDSIRNEVLPLIEDAIAPIIDLVQKDVDQHTLRA